MTLSRFDIAAGLIIFALILISVYNHWKNDGHTVGSAQGLGVKELIEEVKSELVKTEQNRIATGQASLFELKDFELEIKFVVSEQLKGSGQIEYKVVTIGGETTYNSEKVQTIKLHMTAAPPTTGQVPAINPPATGEKSGVVTYDPLPPGVKDNRK